MRAYRSRHVSIDVLLTWGTTRFAAVRVRHDPRSSGVSNYSFKKLLTHAINMLTGFSTFPLQLASLSNDGPTYHVAQEFRSTRQTRQEKLNVEGP